MDFRPLNESVWREVQPLPKVNKEANIDNTCLNGRSHSKTGGQLCVLVDTAQ